MSRSSEGKAAIQALALLFPDQHPQCIEWLKGVPSVMGRPSVSSTVLPRTVGAASASPRVKSSRPSSQAAPFAKSPGKALPWYAKLVTEEPAVWSKRGSNSASMSLEQQTKLWKVFEDVTGLYGATRGMFERMMLLTKDITIQSGKAVQLELFIPKVPNPLVLLLRLYVSGHLWRQVELKREHVTKRSMHELAEIAGSV